VLIYPNDLKIIDAISKLYSKERLFYCFDDGVGTGDDGFFEVLGVGHGDVNGSDSFDGRVEVVECFSFVDDSGDFSADAALGEAVLDSDEPAGLDDAADDGVAVQRLDGAQVDDFAGNALLRQLLRSLQRVLHAARVPHDRHVLPLPHHLRLPDGHHEVTRQHLLAHLEGLPVKILVLQENHHFS
jgi:hypothetical protein